jgi:hypothetical protein
MKSSMIIVVAVAVLLAASMVQAATTSLWSGSLSATSVAGSGGSPYVGYAGTTLLELVNGQAGPVTITGTMQFGAIDNNQVEGAFLQVGLITKSEYLRAENPSSLGAPFTALSVDPSAKNASGAGVMLAEGHWYSSRVTGFSFDYSGEYNGGIGFLDGGVMNTQASTVGFDIGNAGASVPFSIVMTPSGLAGGLMNVTVNGSTPIATGFAYGQDNWKIVGKESKYWLNPEDYTESYLVAHLATFTDNVGTVVTASFSDVQANFVPEPATMALLAAGGIATLLRRRRSSKK